MYHTIFINLYTLITITVNPVLPYRLTNAHVTSSKMSILLQWPNYFSTYISCIERNP
jgi:hypothetical protein